VLLRPWARLPQALEPRYPRPQLLLGQTAAGAGARCLLPPALALLLQPWVPPRRRPPVLH
jgi:hypothetical protein